MVEPQGWFFVKWVNGHYEEEDLADLAIREVWLQGDDFSNWLRDTRQVENG